MNALYCCRQRSYFPCSICFSSLWVEVFLYFHLIALGVSQTNFASHYSCRPDLHHIQLPLHISMTTWYHPGDFSSHSLSKHRDIHKIIHLKGMIQCLEHNTIPSSQVIIDIIQAAKNFSILGTTKKNVLGFGSEAQWQYSRPAYAIPWVQSKILEQQTEHGHMSEHEILNSYSIFGLFFWVLEATSSSFTNLTWVHLYWYSQIGPL